tara:strand:+ start:2496 stop:3014 length:519 start_codon:yes stop_codon:yes gene_type:complete
MSDLRTKNQKRQWIDLEIMEEAAEFERDLFDQLGSPRLSAEPVAWIRYCADGSYEGPIVDSMMETLRKESGAWTPLFERDAEIARLLKSLQNIHDHPDAARIKAAAAINVAGINSPHNAWRAETTPACWCETCRPIKIGKDMRMVLCPECGNKRCPRATNHIYQCTARKDAK